MKGLIKEDLEPSEVEEEPRYLNYIASDDFEVLDSRYFSLEEINYLLASSDHH